MKKIIMIGSKAYDWKDVENVMEFELCEKLHREIAPCTNEKFYRAYKEAYKKEYHDDFDQVVIDACKGYKLYELSDKELIALYQDSEESALCVCEELCERAGLLEAWEAADGESFESVVEEAIEKLERE